jgi:hypothetical protein
VDLLSIEALDALLQHRAIVLAQQRLADLDDVIGSEDRQGHVIPTIETTAL